MANFLETLGALVGWSSGLGSRLAVMLVLYLAVADVSVAQDTKLDSGDKYVACVIGRAVVLVQRGLGSEEAQQLAYKSCGKPPASLSSGDDGGEGYSDFINLAVSRFSGQ